MSEAILDLAWRLLVALLRAAVWPIAWTVRRVAAWLRGPPPEGVPCPVCGYDCRGFDARQSSHRCPECGTELRWGMVAGMRRSKR